MAQAKDYALGPEQFPRGWFAIAEANELGETPLALRFFGQDFALYRGASGRIVLLDAHCAHMGTHLTASRSAAIVQSGKQIEEDSIRCPYHGWRYGPDGKVDDIPYHDGPCPKSAAINTYPVQEVMGCIMMWFDPQQQDPDYPPPQLQEWQDPAWIHWQLDHLGELDLHPQEILDNMADARHLGPTHDAPCEYFETEFKEHIYIQRQGGWHHAYDKPLYSTTWYTGPGVLLSKQLFGNVNCYEFIANTPVEDGRVKVWHGVLSQTNNIPATEKDKAAARDIQAGALATFAADFDIWQHKRPATRIIQLPGDGPFAKGRLWYKQFYQSREESAKTHDQLHGQFHVNGLAQPSIESRLIEEGLF